MNLPLGDLEFMARTGRAMGYRFILDGDQLTMVRADGTTCIQLSKENGLPGAWEATLAAARTAGILDQLPPRLPVITPEEAGDCTPQLLREMAMDFGRSCMEKDGRINAPAMGLFVRRDHQTLAVLEKPTLLLVGCGSEFMNPEGDSKDVYAAKMRDLIRRSEAFGVSLTHEAWMVRTRDGQTRGDLPRDLSEHPGREEVVLVTVEHDHLPPRPEIYRAEITRNPAGDPILGPFTQHPGDAQGRMLHWLRPPVNA